MRAKKNEKIRQDERKKYIPRDVSWLDFNRRVLQEGLDSNVPVAERLKFLAITSSNLDEFFKVRVANAIQRSELEKDSRFKFAEELLDAISTKTHALIREQAFGMMDVFRQLQRLGLNIKTFKTLNKKAKSYLRDLFAKDILPILTPLAVEDIEPTPLLPALQLHAALLVRVPKSAMHFKSAPHRDSKAEENSEAKDFDEKLVVAPIPSNRSRWIKFNETPEGEESYVFLEDLIASNADILFPGCQILANAIFRITRDEDVNIQGSMETYAQDVAHAVLSRRHREPVRLEISDKTNPIIRQKLMSMLLLQERDVYDVPVPLDATVLFELAEMPKLRPFKYEDWAPVEPADLLDCEDIYTRIAERDVLIFLPYEKFDPVWELLDRAAEDPDVLAIKQTLYRTSGNSPIVKSLVKASQNGKEVTVLVELRARFDEFRNIRWTQLLEDAGCHVIYGIAGLKTHAKAMLIVRRERGRIVRYAHLSTGNYNDKTARLYSDLGLMTCDPEITSDVAAFFNILTGYSDAVGWKRLTVEPMLLKKRFLELIEREIAVSTPEQPGRIRVKMNSLEDQNVIDALYRASQRGVKIDLNIRGICCLRPGVAGLSENISVCSIIDRFLEHARIFYFENGGDSEIYLASSDWMTRNLEHRLEILFPVLSPALRERVRRILDVYFVDNQKSQELLPDGTWRKKKPQRGEESLRAQLFFHNESVEMTSRPSHPPVRYVPIQKPSE
ncbi:MAG: polyphosphate kinase 1 [Planctomycetia bacterium]|nr:polyphosphate kinase 1 [Planctomycetia bacterium]